MTCSRKGHGGGAEATDASTFHASVTGGYAYTDLVFLDGSELGFSKASTLYSSDFLLSPSVLLSVGAGGVFFGKLELPPSLRRGDDRSLVPGWIASFAATFRVVKDEGALPYVLLSASASALRSAIREQPAELPGVRGSYTGIDLRFGVTVGKTFADVVSPYVAARVFGGPVIWTEQDDELGSDLYHFQPALGLSLVLPAHLDLFAECQPWFERGFTVGVGLSN